MTIYRILFLKLIGIWLPEKSCRLALNVELGSWDVPSILTLFHISFGIWIFQYIQTSILTLFHFNLGLGSFGISRPPFWHYFIFHLRVGTFSVFHPNIASHFNILIIDFILTSLRISFNIWICQNLSCCNAFVVID